MLFAPPEVKSLSKYSEFGSHLGIKDFGLMVALAIMVHLFFMIIYSMTPREQTAIVPVRVLNIKFSGGSAGNELDMPPAASMPGYVPPEEKTVEMPHEKSMQTSANSTYNRQKPLMEILTQNKDKRVSGKLDEVLLKDHVFSTPKKYIREVTAAADTVDNDKAKGNGSGIAGTKEGEEIVSHYEQEISLWLTKHKNYPESAKQDRVEGNAVVRIRINREGHILFSAIDVSSGNASIDQAVIDMVGHSDPVPKVPDNYPEGKELEFLIPVSFKLK